MRHAHRSEDMNAQGLRTTFEDEMVREAHPTFAAQRRSPGKPDGIAIILFVVLMEERMRHPISASCTLYVICRATVTVLDLYCRLGLKI